MWMETASAPSAIASSTVQTCTLSFGSGLSEVDPERWMKRPMSRPFLRWPRFTSPLWSTIAFAPPSLTSEMTFVISRSPSICPIENPWSIGTMTARPVFRFIIRSILISFPIMFHTFNSSIASSTLLFACTIHAAARTNRSGVRCWNAFLPMEIPAAPPAIAPSISSSVVRSSVFEPPATTTGTGHPRVTSRKESGSPV